MPSTCVDCVWRNSHLILTYLLSCACGQSWSLLFDVQHQRSQRPKRRCLVTAMPTTLGTAWVARGTGGWRGYCWPTWPSPSSPAASPVPRSSTTATTLWVLTLHSLTRQQGPVSFLYLFLLMLHLVWMGWKQKYRFAYIMQIYIKGPAWISASHLGDCWIVLAIE